MRTLQNVVPLDHVYAELSSASSWLFIRASLLQSLICHFQRCSRIPTFTREIESRFEIPFLRGQQSSQSSQGAPRGQHWQPKRLSRYLTLRNWTRHLRFQSLNSLYFCIVLNKCKRYNTCITLQCLDFDFVFSVILCDFQQYNFILLIQKL